MAIDPTYPGVYIDEISTGGPIAGVGTSTAAFVGPAQSGPLFVPVKVTNWTEFKNAFGDAGAGPGYTAYAVKGFFDNGGTAAYIVRVGKGQRASLDLAGRGRDAGAVLHVEAKREGTAGNSITVAVEDAQIAATAMSRARARINAAQDKVITLSDIASASKFRVGDIVTIETTSERAVIERIKDADLSLRSNLTASHDDGFVRIADLAVGQTSFRVDDATGLEPGSVIAIAQGQTSETQAVKVVSGNVITVAGDGLGNAYTLAEADTAVAVSSMEFTLTAAAPGGQSETFPKLSMDQRHRRYWGAVVRSSLVNVTPPAVPTVLAAPNDRPAAVRSTPLANGASGDALTLGLEEYERGLETLVPILDVQLVCAPDCTDQAVQQAIVAHCEAQGDRFAILDAAMGLDPDSADASDLMKQRAWCASQDGYASFYYPWLLVANPIAGRPPLKIPPSGHMAGIFARVDAQRGVHKAPANELIVGAIGLETIVDNNKHGGLNLAGINVLRVFPGEVRPIVWGARTTTPRGETQWLHNSVRRLLIFVETSLRFGLRPWVFEPNDTGLWKRLDRTITEFLTRVWRSGALFGGKASEAFYVKIDEELNPPAVRALGQVIIEIGLAPVHPAEFVVVRIGIWEGGTSITEV